MNPILRLYVGYIKTTVKLKWFDRLDKFLASCEGADLDILLTLLVQTLPFGKLLPSRELLLLDSRIEPILKEKLSCLK